MKIATRKVVIKYVIVAVLVLVAVFVLTPYETHQQEHGILDLKTTVSDNTVTSTKPHKATSTCSGQLSSSGRKLLLFGDSLTAGAYFNINGSLSFHSYKYQLQNVLSDWHIEFKGYPGGKSSELLQLIPQIRRRLNFSSYTGVILLAGTNDLLRPTQTLDQISDNVHIIAKTLQNNYNTSWVLYLKVPIVSPVVPAIRKVRKRASYCKTGHLSNPKITQFNKILTKKLDRCRHIDPFSELPQDNRTLWSDCVHPNEVGYDYLGNIIGNKLRDMLRD